MLRQPSHQPWRHTVHNIFRAATNKSYRVYVCPLQLVRDRNENHFSLFRTVIPTRRVKSTTSVKKKMVELPQEMTTMNSRRRRTWSLIMILLFYQRSAMFQVNGFSSSTIKAIPRHRSTMERSSSWIIDHGSFTNRPLRRRTTRDDHPYDSARMNAMFSKRNDEDNNENDNDDKGILNQKSRQLNEGNNSKPQEKELMGDLIRIEQTGLVTADIFAIAIASQLMGLLDVLNDPTFYQNGGWFQSIPTVPTTFGTLIQRFSLLTITWIVCAILRGGYTNGAIESSSSSSSSNTNDGDGVMLSPSIQLSLKIWITFCIFRFGFGTALAYLSTQDYSIFADGTNTDLLGELTRQCYIVGLTTFTARYFYSRLFG